MQELQTIYDTYPLSIRDVARRSNVTRVRVQQLVSKIEIAGLALYVGQTWRLKPGAIDWMRNRDNRRK